MGVFVVSELFNIAVNDVDAKKSARYSRVLAVTELVVSGTQWPKKYRKIKQGPKCLIVWPQNLRCVPLVEISGRSGVGARDVCPSESNIFSFSRSPRQKLCQIVG